MAIGLLVLAVPRWRQTLNVAVPQVLYGYLFLISVHVGSALLSRRRHCDTFLFISLCIDLLALVYGVSVSGGIRSPLMPAQIVLTMIFALLFPSPLAILPPLMLLPVTTAIDQLSNTNAMPGDLLLVLWYSALNVIVVYIVVYLDGREKLALNEVFQLQRERRKNALATQRTRIARDIHDGVGAALSNVMLQAEYLASQATSTSTKTELVELREASVDAMEELRRAVSLLHQEFQLATVVPEYADSIGARHHVAISCDLKGREPSLDAEVALAAFRVLQEALANIIRHARSSAVSVNLSFSATNLTLTVCDDGIGFEPHRVVGRHYGLRGMVERVGRLGGDLQIESRPHHGTVVTARIPFA